MKAPVRRVRFSVDTATGKYDTSYSHQSPEYHSPAAEQYRRCLRDSILKDHHSPITMLAAALLPARFRGEQPFQEVSRPSWLNRRLTPVLQFFTRLSSAHPIHTIVIVALLASTTYMGLLQESLFDAGQTIRRAEWSSLLEGSRHLWVGKDTDWKWQSLDSTTDIPATADHLTLVTLVFPETFSPDASRAPPRAKAIPIPQNLSIKALPTTANSLTSYSQDSSLAFSLPYSQAPEFLSVAQEIPNNARRVEKRETSEYGQEKKMWIMKAARVQTRSSLSRWVLNGWTEFIDLLKNAETLDIVVMVLGYISMHLTFVSLFLSMRRMGSNFWLATSVLISSIFAFLFGLLVTTRLGVPINMVLLSEGLPFLVVTIGFEKNIALTRAVLSHAAEHRKPRDNSSPTTANQVGAGIVKSTSLIQKAIQAAIKETGFQIVKDYAIEITLLIAGAASGVQGGLQHFCFLAAWILFFDCLLLFSFYSAILCVKLEIKRIKRHVDLRKALEDDGISRRVAESVAQSNDWPQMSGKGQSSGTLFGRKFKSASIPKFKVLMVGCFLIINAVNICTLPFRSDNSLSSISSWARSFRSLSGVVTPLPVDPFKVASNGLDAIFESARLHNQETVVTVLTPIKYELEYPSVHYDLPQSGSGGEEAFDSLGGYAVGGQMVGGILKSLEDPVLSKWIVVALAMSVALNGYLFNAARAGIRDPNLPDHPIDPRELAQAQRFNESESATLPLGEYMRPATKTTPPTPASTDDEGDALALKGLALTPRVPATPRNDEETLALVRGGRMFELLDEEIIALSLKGKIAGHSLEEKLKNYDRAVKLRRAIISRTKATSDLTGFLERSKLPYENYNWAQVYGACCENVIGYMPLPVGVAGPLVIDGQSYFLPMATTEGVLIASASRGCKAVNHGGGAVTELLADGMTRGPCVSFETLHRAATAKRWLDSDVGQSTMKRAFNETSGFARLIAMKTAIAGTNLYIRFKATTGDAMGMNMISKGVENALRAMLADGFEDMNIVSLSGNFCTDKKAAAINWIDGRGKSVVAEAVIPADIVKSVLKTDVDTMIELNVSKNLIGSAMAGAIGGFNAHAANIVAAMYLALGQDPAQVVESANCITIMKNYNGALQITVSMPSLEVGTLGGGTILEPQSAMLDLLGVRGPHTTPGENARRLARIIAAAVLAAELSLCSALAAGHLVNAHMRFNRSAPPTRATTPAPLTPLTNGPGTGLPSGNTSGNATLSRDSSFVGLAMTSATDKSSPAAPASGLSAAAVERARR